MCLVSITLLFLIEAKLNSFLKWNYYAWHAAIMHIKNALEMYILFVNAEFH